MSGGAADVGATLAAAVSRMEHDLNFGQFNGDDRFGRAMVTWLTDIASRHAADPEQIGLYLHLDDDGPCEVCEDGGHLSTVCRGCHPTWDGMDAHSVYPCAETRAAAAIATAYLGTAS